MSRVPCVAGTGQPVPSGDENGGERATRGRAFRGTGLAGDPDRRDQPASTPGPGTPGRGVRGQARRRVPDVQPLPRRGDRAGPARSRRGGRRLARRGGRRSRAGLHRLRGAGRPPGALAVRGGGDRGRDRLAPAGLLPFAAGPRRGPADPVRAGRLLRRGRRRRRLRRRGARAGGSTRCCSTSTTPRATSCTPAMPRSTRRRVCAGWPRCCARSGVFALWSDDPPDAEFTARAHRGVRDRAGARRAVRQPADRRAVGQHRLRGACRR